MSTTTPDPNGGPHRVSHATVVVVDAATGLPTSPLTDTALRASAISVSTTQLPASLGAKTATASLSIAPASDTTFPVEPLGTPSIARQVAVTIASANQALTATCRRISIRARTSDMRYSVGAVAQTASATTSHFIGADERLDIAVPLSAHIAVIRDSTATADGTLCISELT